MAVPGRRPARVRAAPPARRARRRRPSTRVGVALALAVLRRWLDRRSPASGCPATGGSPAGVASGGGARAAAGAARWRTPARRSPAVAGGGAAGAVAVAEQLLAARRARGAAGQRRRRGRARDHGRPRGGVVRRLRLVHLLAVGPAADRRAVRRLAHRRRAGVARLVRRARALDAAGGGVAGPRRRRVLHLGPRRVGAAGRRRRRSRRSRATPPTPCAYAAIRRGETDVRIDGFGRR